NSQNIRDILLNVAIVALLAIGETVVVVTRNIDLSVGSVLGISAFLTGVLFADHHVAIPVAFAAGILFGALFGVLNGAMVPLARLAGVLYAARFGTIDANAGTGQELAVVSAVVVGGVAIFGGSGSVYGAALGALLLACIGSALVILKVDQFWEQAIDGFLLLV